MLSLTIMAPVGVCVLGFQSTKKVLFQIDICNVQHADAKLLFLVITLSLIDS